MSFESLRFVVVVDMEENNSAELEEGEAFYGKEEEGDNNNIDLDISLSYIDEKIQNILGHFQKDFEGGVTAENLGAKFGGYGSFLPTYERSSSSLSHQRCPERSSISTKSQNILATGGVLRNSQAPATAPPSSRLKATQGNADKLHNAKFPSGNLSGKQVNQELRFCCDPIAENPTGDGILVKSVNKASQRPLKVLIRMGSDNNTKMNAALYGGLGLEGSPSTSFDSSSQESGEFPSFSVGTANLSPGSILQVMTSFPVPCSELVSPLDESLLSFVKDKLIPKDNKPAENVKVSPVKNTESVDQFVTVHGDEMLSKPNKIKSERRNEKPAEVNNGSTMIFDNKRTFPLKQKVKNEMLAGESSLFYKFGKSSLSCTGNISEEPSGIADKASEVFGETNNVKVKRKLSSTLVKESPLKSISSLNYGAEVDNRQRITIANAGGHGVSSFLDSDLFDSVENGKRKGDEAYVPSKDRSHVAKNEEEFSSGEADYSKWKASHEGPRNECNENAVTFRDKKPIIGVKKKSKCRQLDDKVILSENDQLKVVAGIAGKGKKKSSHDIIPSKKKVLALASGKNLTGPGSRMDRFDSLNVERNHSEAPVAGSQRDAGSTFPAVEHDSVLGNSRETNANGVISSSFSGAPVKDAAAVVPTSEMVPATASLLENWVCCDLCEKWRLLPNGIKPEDLPRKWMCSMLDWLPGMNSCDIHEDVTTGIMRGSIPCPGLESQDHANGSVFGVTSNVQYLQKNHRNVRTIDTDGQGKSKLGPKEIVKKRKGEPVKSRSLNNTNPPPAEWNSLRRCNLPDSKSRDLALGRDMPKQKENLNTGDKKLNKEKSKKRNDQFKFETSKRTKRDEIDNGAEHGSDTKVCRTSVCLGMPKLTLVKGKGQSGECNPAKEVKHGLGGRLILSIKNLRNQAQVSTDCNSMQLKASSSLKKRKLKGSRDSQIDGGPYQHSMQDNKVIPEEETDECMLRKGKKSRFSDTGMRDLSSEDSNSRSKKEGKAVMDFPSGIKKCFTDGVEEDRHPNKNRKKLAPRQATSSSSKVSGSHKSRVNNEVQGSPVESVSSFPLRINYSATSMQPDILTRGDGVNGGLPVMDVSKDSGDKVNNGRKRSGIATEKEFRGIHSKSLESGFFEREDKSFPGFQNGDLLDGTTDYPQYGEVPANLTSNDNGVYMKQPGTALHLGLSGNPSSIISNGKGRNNLSESNRDKVGTLETAGEKVAEALNKVGKYESLVKAIHSSPFCEDKSHVNPDPAQKNVKNHTGRNLSKQNNHALSDGGLGNHYSDYGLESPSKNCPDPTCKVEAAPELVESMSGKEILLLHPEEEGKQGTPTWGSQLVGQRNICNRHPVDTTGNSDLSNTLLRNEKNDTSNCLERLTSKTHIFKDPLSSSTSRANQSVRTACIVLKEAEKLRDLADRLKGSKFGFEGNESYFEAAVKFLKGASLLETGNGQSSRYREMTPLQVYITAAKLCESCAAEFERCQDLAAAALAYKCIEVAYMRVVYCKYASLSKDRQELLATLHQGESPSSSVSDVDNLNNQAVVDGPNLSTGAGTHADVVAQNRPSFVRLLDFTQEVNLAMEASRKCQVAFMAANAIMEESQNKEHIITSLKKVIDFSFHDIDGLVRLMELARKAISRSGFTGAKD